MNISRWKEVKNMVKQEIKSFTLDCSDIHGAKATVPCSLYSVLNENKYIDDIYTDDGVASVRKFSGLPCVFTSEFEVTSVIMSMKSILLRFYGIDSFCRIELNGTELASVCNAHRIYDIDVRRHLHMGNNVLRLCFDPSAGGDAVRSIKPLKNNGVSGYYSDMGVFKKIELIGYNHKMIKNVKIKQTHLEKSVVLDLELETVGYDEMSRAVATLTSPAGNVYFCGFMNDKGSITVTDPNLWWPSGMGVQSIYKMSVSLYSDSIMEDTLELNVGLRRITLQRDDTGEERLYINGAPFFPLGAHYVPDDVIAASSSRDRISQLLYSAKNANFNSIFIDNNGTYADDHFLDLCDRLGIAVWQQIPDSGITEAARHDIKAEIYDNVTRMSMHPSLAVITGSENISKAFSTDTEREEFISSLSCYDGMSIADIDGKIAGKLATVSYSSLPTYSTICKFASPEHRNIGSYAFELHGAGDDVISSMISESYNMYPYANGMKELSYTMGLSAADNVAEDVSALRQGKGSHLGILVGSLNDPWVSVSESSVDYFGGRKPLYYYERRLFSPVCIMLDMKGTRAKFTLSNISKTDYYGVFSYAVMDNLNRPVFRDSFPIKLNASSSMDVHNVDLGSVISGHEHEYYLLYSVFDNNIQSSKGVHLFTKAKRFKFLKPDFRVDITGSKTAFTVSVASDCYAHGVEISFNEIEAQISDNYFDITGKSPVKVEFTTPGVITVEKLKRLLRIKSVYDLGHEE